MKTQRIKFFLVTFIAVSCMIFPFIKQVQADQFSVYTRVTVPTPGNPPGVNAVQTSYGLTGPFNISSVSASGTNWEQYSGSTYGQASATATYGGLGVYAFSKSDTDPGSTNGRWGIAYGESYFSDTITVTSTVLPFGTRVNINIGLNLDGNFSYNGVTGNMGNINGPEDTYAMVELFIPTGTGGPPFLYLYENANNRTYYPWPVSDYISGNYAANVGYPFVIVAYLFVETMSSTYVTWPYLPPAESISISDFSNTAILTITLLTPDVSITSASGTIYAESISSVPEPTTMLLLGSGLIGLAGYGRKKFFKK